MKVQNAIRSSILGYFAKVAWSTTAVSTKMDLGQTLTVLEMVSKPPN